MVSRETQQNAQKMHILFKGCIFLISYANPQSFSFLKIILTWFETKLLILWRDYNFQVGSSQFLFQD